LAASSQLPPTGHPGAPQRREQAAAAGGDGPEAGGGRGGAKRPLIFPIRAELGASKQRFVDLDVHGALLRPGRATRTRGQSNDAIDLGVHLDVVALLGVRL
jgi:hypothetical protein